MVPIKEIEIPLTWGTLRGRTWGESQAEPILALHGWLDNASTFDRLFPEMDLSAFVVAIDQAGHGQSDHRTGARTYQIMDFVHDIAEVADHFKWKRFSLLGHSLGGGVAALFAGAVPKRVNKLALVESVGPVTGLPSEAPARTLAMIEDFASLAQKKLPEYDTVEGAAEARRKVGDLSEEAALCLVKRSLKATKNGFTWNSDPRLRLPSLRLTPDQNLAFLAAIQCPTLVIEASRGLLPQLADLRTRKDQIKELTWVTLDGGHHLHLDSPKETASKLTAFFQKNTPATNL